MIVYIKNGDQQTEALEINFTCTIDLEMYRNWQKNGNFRDFDRLLSTE